MATTIRVDFWRRNGRNEHTLSPYPYSPVLRTVYTDTPFILWSPSYRLVPRPRHLASGQNLKKEPERGFPRLAPGESLGDAQGYRCRRQRRRSCSFGGDRY